MALQEQAEHILNTYRDQDGMGRKRASHEIDEPITPLRRPSYTQYTDNFWEGICLLVTLFSEPEIECANHLIA